MTKLLTSDDAKLLAEIAQRQGYAAFAVALNERGLFAEVAA